MRPGSDPTAELAVTAEMSPKGTGIMVGTDPGATDPWTTGMATMHGMIMVGMQLARTDIRRVTATGTSANVKKKRTR